MDKNIPPFPDHKKDVAADIKIQNLEKQQQLRDAHVDSRFDGIEKNFTVLSNRVTGMEDKMDMGFDKISAAITSSRDYEDRRISELYHDMRKEREAESTKASTVKVSTMWQAASVMIAAALLCWGIVELKIDPVLHNLTEHKGEDIHIDGGERIALLEERTAENRLHSDQQLKSINESSAVRDDKQQTEIDRLVYRQDQLFDDRVRVAKLEGKLLAYHEWIRDDVESNKDDLTHHTEQANHPFGVMMTDIAKLQGFIDELSRRVNDIDNHGSRKWNDSDKTKPEVDND